MPTVKQKKVFKRAMEGEPVSKAMVESGYKESTAVNPQQLTKSKGWQELMETYLPDRMLMRVHKQGLKATKKELTGETPDYATRHKYLDTAYKIKAKFPREPGVGVAVQVNINEDREKFK